MSALAKKEIKILEALESGEDFDWGAAVGAALETLSSRGNCTKGPAFKITQAGREFLMMYHCWVPKYKLHQALVHLERPSKIIDFWCWWWLVAVPNSGVGHEVPPARDYVEQSISSRMPNYTSSVEVALNTVPDECEWNLRHARFGDWHLCEMLIRQPTKHLASPVACEGRHGLAPIAVLLASLQLVRRPT